jgi:hypothetical protein
MSRNNVRGLGPVNPPLATGQTAPADTPSTPVAEVTATIGGKNARVISAQASELSAGVVDIWLSTPDLYDGDHYISVGAMGAFTSTRIPIKVKSRKHPLHQPRAGISHRSDHLWRGLQMPPGLANSIACSLPAPARA